MKYAYKKISPAELNEINPQTMKALHNVFGIDWKKPAAVVRFDAPPTKAAVLKAAEEIQIPAPAVVLYHRTKWSDYDKTRFYAFTVSESGVDNPKIPYRENTGDALSDTWAKKHFDEWRKDPREAATVYTVYQAKRDRSAPEKIGKPNEYTRYTITATETGCYNNGPKAYKLRPVDRNKDTAAATINYYHKDGKTQHDQPEDILDRSGYYVRDRRENLKRRAAALKAEREKTAYNAQETTADAETVTAAADALRKYAAGLLLDPDMHRAAVAASALNIYGYRFADSISDALKFSRKSKNHEYKSAKDAENAMRWTLDYIGKAREDIKKYFEEKTTGGTQNAN